MRLVDFSVKGLPTLKHLAAVLNMEGNTNSITALSPPSLIFHREKQREIR
jgi:hypothetical protein